MQLSNHENHENRDLCTICQDDFVGQTDKETLVCGHCFHLECIKRMHNDRCPLCRASLQSPNITEVERRQMRIRQMDDLNESVFESVEIQEEIVPIGSQLHRDAVVHILLHVNGYEIGRSELDFLIDEYHDVVHSGPLGGGRFNCEVVDNFIVDIFECMHKHADEVILDPNDELFQEVISWFCERLVVSPRNETLHQAAHHVFETVPCEHLHQYARTAVRVLIGAELVSMALSAMNEFK